MAGDDGLAGQRAERVVEVAPQAHDELVEDPPLDLGASSLSERGRVIYNGVSLDEWRQGRLVGTVQEVGEQLARWQELGVGSLVVSVAAVPFSVGDDDAIDLVARACSLVPR